MLSRVWPPLLETGIIQEGGGLPGGSVFSDQHGWAVAVSRDILSGFQARPGSAHGENLGFHALQLLNFCGGRKRDRTVTRILRNRRSRGSECVSASVHVWTLSPRPHKCCVHSQPWRQSFKNFEQAVEDTEWVLKGASEAMLLWVLRKTESQANLV